MSEAEKPSVERLVRIGYMAAFVSRTDKPNWNPVYLPWMSSLLRDEEAGRAVLKQWEAQMAGMFPDCTREVFAVYASLLPTPAALDAGNTGTDGVAVDARGVIVSIADQPLADAASVLAEFAKTAPGRLPQRVQDAIAVVDGVGGTDGR